MAEFRCTCDWSNYSHSYLFGDRINFYSKRVTEDFMNYYVHGINSESVPGIFANYLALPKYAFRREVGK